MDFCVYCLSPQDSIFGHYVLFMKRLLCFWWGNPFYKVLDLFLLPRLNQIWLIESPSRWSPSLYFLFWCGSFFFFFKCPKEFCCVVNHLFCVNDQDAIFEWQNAIRGSADTEFEAGIYHGRIQLPAEYPFQHPSFLRSVIKLLLKEV